MFKIDAKSSDDDNIFAGGRQNWHCDAGLRRITAIFWSCDTYRGVKRITVIIANFILKGPSDVEISAWIYEYT